MENKTTSELLDFLWKIEKKSEKAEDGHFDWDKHNEAYAELCKRTPFNDILGSKKDPNDMTHEEQLEDIQKTLKLLKRHKHDEKSGDVMVKI